MSGESTADTERAVPAESTEVDERAVAARSSSASSERAVVRESADRRELRPGARVTVAEVWAEVWARRAYAQLIVSEYPDREPEHTFVVGVAFGDEPLVIEDGLHDYAVTKVVIERDQARVYGRRRGRRGRLKYAERYLMGGPAPV